MSLEAKVNRVLDMGIKVGLAATLTVAAGAVAMDQTGHSIGFTNEGILWKSEGNCAYDPDLGISLQHQKVELIEFPSIMQNALATKNKSDEPSVRVIDFSPVKSC